MKKYDLIVIGSGGGSKLVRPCADMGLKVAVIERDKLGGTCLNHGCIPSKMLIHPADIGVQIQEASRFSIQVATDFTVDFKRLVNRVNSTIDIESESIAPLYEKHENIDLYWGEARFQADKVIRVEDEILTAERIFLPVGCRPTIPAIAGLSDTPFWTYNEALRNTKQPKKLLIIGGGYIATELGHFFGSLGTDVEFLQRSTFLRREDRDVQKEFEKVFTERFDCKLGIDYQEVSYDKGTFTVRYKDRQGHECKSSGDQLLVVTGVQPNSDTLFLENSVIQLDRNGYIKVDNHLQTTVEGVYAFGDVIGRSLYRHTANFEGEYLFRSLYGEPNEAPITYPPVPHAVFSNPQIGGVGKKEQELEAEGIDYYVGLNRYADSAMGMALRSEYGFVKLLFEKGSDQLLGAHIIGEEAATMVHMLIAYMQMGATLQDLLDTIYIHPALPEVVRNAARKAKAAKTN